MNIKEKRFSLIFAIVIAVGGFLLYFNTLNGPFLFDDYTNIVNNMQIREIRNFLPPPGTRGIGYLTFALNYKFSMLDVSAYHAVNILIHICNAILIYALYLQLLRKFSPDSYMHNRLLIASSAALVFLVHPLQTGAVSYIVQRFTSLATFFFLFSVVMYIKASEAYSERNSFFSKAHLPYYLLSIISAVLGMKTKEITLTIPVIIFMSEIFLLYGTDRGARIAKKPFTYFIPFGLTFFIIPAGFINTDVPIGEMIGEISDKSFEAQDIGRADYLFTQFRVIATYLRLVLMPYGQNLDYDYRISTDFLELSVLLSLLLHLLIIAASFLIFFKTRKSAGLVISFGIFWFYITLLVESSIIPIKDVIFEHRLYLPSSGLIASFVTVIYFSVNKIFKEKGIKPAIAIIASASLIFSILTIKRNLLWRDGVAIWEDTIKKSPNKARPHANLANLYHEMGLYNKAEDEYLKAIGISPSFAGLYNNLGNVYKAQGRYDEAIKEYRTSIRIDPRFAEGYYNLGATLYEIGDMEEAHIYLEKTLEISPEFFDAYVTIGNIFDDIGMKEKALRAYAKALEVNPYSHMAYYNRGVLYEGMGDIENARKDFRRAIEIAPGWELPRKHLESLGN
ncbi:MAG: tetratricopeptide repeat protein [Nitrospirota bacterium]